MAYEALSNLRDDDVARYFMVGYQLQNTVTENGSVARGVCEVDENSYLLSVTERTHIVKSSDGALYTEDGLNYRLLPENALVSMNMWGFPAAMMDAIEEGFPRFLAQNVPQNPLKAEYYLPMVVNGMLDKGTATVEVLKCPSRWYLSLIHI